MSESDGNVRYDAWLRRDSPRPGGYIVDWMEDAAGTGMTVSASAARLDISQKALSRVLNERASISTVLALKLEAVGLGKADMWNSMPAHYDLVQERNRTGQWPPDPITGKRQRGCVGGSLTREIPESSAVSHDGGWFPLDRLLSERRWGLSGRAV